ncbi:SPRY domain-containing protein [Dechloromonas agitata]|uniref:hypothetical protein n=1 Tax=Dechloromonas agitata TaxID=73030 RepID=UPI0012FB40F2|nr:hypothetical protein [Dechloromonas agitata]
MTASDLRQASSEACFFWAKQRLLTTFGAPDLTCDAYTTDIQSVLGRQMKPTLIKPLVAALALGASVPAALAAISYQYRMPVPGLTVNAVVTPSTPQVPSLVGDGVSTVGGCTSGATGCATWNPTDRTSATTLSADNLVVQLPNRTIAGGIRATVGKTTGKWYWELTIRSTGANNFGSLEPIYSEIGVLLSARV